MTQSYDLSSDYKTAFMADVSALISAVIMPRSQRVLAVQTLIDSYVRDTGKAPDSTQLERLSDAILYEELTDTHPDKLTRAEYPFMSEWQFELRRDRETSLKVAEEYGTDGTNYTKPVKRRRTAVEQASIDYEAKWRNRARSAQYKRDTSAGPVVRYNLRDKLTEPFVDCIGISEHMRRMAERTLVIG
jgi:hypothetical protein